MLGTALPVDTLVEVLLTLPIWIAKVPEVGLLEIPIGADDALISTLLLLLVVKQTALFHVVDQLIEGEIGIVECMTRAVELGLPIGKHEAIESVLEGVVIREELVGVGTRHILTETVDQCQATGKFVACHVEGLDGGAKVVVHEAEGIRWQKGSNQFTELG